MPGIIFQKPQSEVTLQRCCASENLVHGYIQKITMNSSDSSLDFVPLSPAELRHAVTQMAACINLADWRFIKPIAAMDRTES